MIPLVGFARRLRGCLVSLAIALVALVACASLTYLARERVLAWVAASSCTRTRWSRRTPPWCWVAAGSSGR